MRDLLVCELQKQNNYLRNERKFNKKYKVKVIEHVINPSGTIQEETIVYRILSFKIFDKPKGVIKNYLFKNSVLGLF